MFYVYAATVESADIPITLQANETIDYKFLPYDKFCDFVQSEPFADSIRERFPAYQNDLVEPCVNMIHNNKNERAYMLYKLYSLKLNQKYKA